MSNGSLDVLSQAPQTTCLPLLMADGILMSLATLSWSLGGPPLLWLMAFYQSIVVEALRGVAACVVAF